MREFIRTMSVLLEIVALIPGTYMVYFCFLFLGSGNVPLVLIAILGIMGYAGLFLLLLERFVNNSLIIILLLFGVLSFVTYFTVDGLWGRMALANMHIWLFYMLPSIVAIISIVRLTIKNLKKNNN